MSVIIAGAGGMVGSALVEALDGHIPVITIGREDLNYKDFYKNIMNNEMLTSLREQNVQAIVNCAGYTNVDAAETDMLNCWSANAIVPQMLGHLALMLDIPIVHLSSDFVYSSKADGEFVKEDDKLGAVNFYGHSKFAGENYLIGQTNKHYIIRTSWLFGGSKRTWIDNYVGGEIPKQYQFSKGSPTYVPDLIEAICFFLIPDQKVPFGVYNFSNKIEVPISKVRTLSAAQHYALSYSKPVVDIEYKEVVLAACRPSNTALDITKFETECYKVRSLEEAVDEYIKNK